MSNFSYYLHYLLIVVIRFFLFFIPKDKNLILFSSWFGQKYADNSKYMFDYLLENSDYNVKWFTFNEALFDEMRKKGLPVVNGKSISGIWCQIRARMLVSSIQTSDYNPFFLCKCIYLDLDHGFSLKQVGFAIPGINSNYVKYQKLLRRGIQFWMTASTPFCKEKIEECYQIEPARIAKCNKPRTDVLFDSKLTYGINKNVDEIKKGRKAIVWMPTHRSCGEKVIEFSKLVDLNALQEICEKKDCVFLIKKHFYHKNEHEDLDTYPNIYDITGLDVDSQVILAQADALVSDYSSSYIEYLVLDRPILLFAYDKDDYLKNERELYIPLEKNTAGEVVLNGEELLKSIARITDDWNDSRFSDGRRKARSLYYNDDSVPGFYREYVKGIIDMLMLDTYSPDWM